MIKEELKSYQGKNDDMLFSSKQFAEIIRILKRLLEEDSDNNESI